MPEGSAAAINSLPANSAANMCFIGGLTAENGNEIPLDASYADGRRAGEEGARR